MPQIGRYPDNMTIGQVFEMVQEIRQNNDLDKELYEAFKIDELAHKKMSTLSGGTTQKVSAVLAFMFSPEVLILDEPTAGRSEEHTSELQSRPHLVCRLLLEKKKK